MEIKNYSDDKISIYNVGAMLGGEAFLITTKQKTALIDSGFSFCAEEMIKNIKGILGDRPLDYVLLTHSHYDHASGSAYCLSHYPHVKVIAGTYVEKIFSRPSAAAVMRDMNESVAKNFGITNFEDKLDDLRVDIAVNEGDVIDLGDISLQVIEAPGHTKCSIAFYIPEEKMLISCETMGVYVNKEVVGPCYLVSYETSINFINRALNMDIEKILVPHHGVLVGDECKEFISNALRSNEMLKDIILENHGDGKTQEEIIEHIKSEFYTEEVQRVQPVKAFELNASYMVPMIIKEFSKMALSS